MKRIIWLLIITILLFLCALWSPWLYLKIDLTGILGLRQKESISGLQVYSLGGEIETFVDNNSVGKITQEKSPMFVERITPGEHQVTLKRISDISNAYWTFNKIINFQEGTNVVISYNLGPSEEFSEGNIVYAIKKKDSDKPNILNVITNINNFIFQIDDIPPVEVDTKTYLQNLNFENQHSIKIKKSGYEDLEFKILPENKDDRTKLKDYDINVEIQMMLQPVKVEVK